MTNDRFELGELLDDRDHLLADLAGEHGHLDEFVVLEAVADDGGIGRFGQGEHGQELGLRAGLDPEMVWLAEIEDLLDDVPLLIDLDRVDAAVTPLVVVLADGRAEGVVDLADAMAEDVGEAKQDRQLNAALLELIDQFLQVDRLAGILVGMNRHVPLGIDPEVVLAPVANAIRFQGIIDLPRIGESMFRTLRHSRVLPFSAGGQKKSVAKSGRTFNFDFAISWEGFRNGCRWVGHRGPMISASFNPRSTLAEAFDRMGVGMGLCGGSSDDNHSSSRLRARHSSAS